MIGLMLDTIEDKFGAWAPLILASIVIAISAGFVLIGAYFFGNDR